MRGERADRGADRAARRCRFHVPFKRELKPMSNATSGRTAECVGEARDRATFLQIVDGWMSTTPALGLTIPLFRGQEDESWLLKPGIARPQYASRVTPDTEARMLTEFKHRAIPHLESTLELADATGSRSRGTTQCRRVCSIGLEVRLRRRDSRSSDQR